MKRTRININSEKLSSKERLIFMPQSLKNCRQEKRDIEDSANSYSSHQDPLSHELVQWKELWVDKNPESRLKGKDLENLSRREVTPNHLSILPGYRGKNRKVSEATFWFLQARRDAGVRRQNNRNHSQIIFSGNK